MSFHSYFWEGIKLEEALTTLKGVGVDVEEKVKSLSILLNSPSTPAQCIAMDRFGQSQSDTRWGKNNPFASLENLLTIRIQEQLAKPPYIRSKLDAKPRIGANHASTFHLMWLSGLDHDYAEKFTTALRSNRDPIVISEGILAAAVILRDETAPFLPLTDLLKDYISDDILAVPTRANAILSLASVANDRFNSYLLDIVKSSQLELAAAAGRSLAERDLQQYQAILRPIVSHWPDDYISYDAEELRNLLSLRE